MGQPFRCPQGHEWDQTDERTDVLGAAPDTCPFCGSVAQTLIPDPSAATDPSRFATGLFAPSADAQREPHLDAVPRDPAIDRGRFTKLRLHARGGLGKVSLARDEDLGRTVALKEIRNRYAEDPHCRMRFVNEAEITGQLEHPGIVPVYSLGRDPRDRPFYAMKFVHGRTLADAIKEYHRAPTPLRLRELLLRFVVVCQAVAYAHSKGVIHRDIKPANIMLGSYGETLVLDWGLAKRLGAPSDAAQPAMPAVPLSTAQYLTPTERAELPSTPLTEAGSVLGTPAYMSPEQAAGEVDSIGPSSDIYALGVILYEMLTGRVPYEADTTEAMLLQVVIAQPPRPSQVNRRVPRPLESICLKALSRLPEQRYRTATELAQDVERWLADEPVAAHHDSLWAQLLRWERRHKPFVVGVAALLLTAAVLAVTFLLVHDRLIRQEQQRTEDEKVRAEENFKDARDAVEEMLAKVGEERLANVPGMDPVRRQLLEKALAFYEKFAARHSDQAETQFDTARANRRVGAIYALLGDKDKAQMALSQARHRLVQLQDRVGPRADFRRELALAEHDLAWHLHRQTDRPRDGETHYLGALGIQKELVAASPHDPISRKELARTWHNYGLLRQITDQPKAALEALSEALRLRRTLASYPGGPESLRELAQTLNDLGQLHQEQGDKPEAAKALREAIILQQEAIDQLPNDPQYKHETPDAEMEMVAFRNNLGLLLVTSDPSAALAEYERAAATAARLMLQYPDRSDYRLKLARTHLNIGKLHTDQKHWDQARAAFLRALPEYQHLADARQGGPDCLSELGLTLNNLALVAYNQKNQAEARDLLARAVQHQRSAWLVNPRHPAYRSRLRDAYQGLAFVQLELKDAAGAAATARELAASVATDWETLHRAACYLAGCVALAEKGGPAADTYAEEAVDLLTRAIDAGLSDPTQLRSANLAPLSQRADFQRLVKALEEKKPAPR